MASTYTIEAVTKRLLITGATGFIGTHVAALAQHEEWEIHLDRVDLLVPAESSRLLARIRPTHLIHLAWFVEPSAYWTSPANQQWAEASAHLFREFARQGGERLVGVGTSAEYDWSGDGVLVEGTTPLVPATPYGASKKQLSEEAAAIGVSHAWARLFLVYGPGEPAARFIPKAIRAHLTGGTVPCVDPAARDFIYVGDAAAALLALAGSDVEGPVNVGSGEATSLHEVARRIGADAEMIRVASEPPLVVADTKRLRGEVGFTPRVSLERGLQESVAWWRERT
jgi:nucleoside-diphosphate-sugar epimerase